MKVLSPLTVSFPQNAAGRILHGLQDWNAATRSSRPTALEWLFRRMRASAATAPSLPRLTRFVAPATAPRFPGQVAPTSANSGDEVWPTGVQGKNGGGNI